MQKLRDLYVFTKFAYNGYQNFTKKGYENQFKKWGDEAVLINKYNLKGKNILITGASSGLGLSAALTFAKMNANVYMLCRDAQKSEKVLSDLQKQTGNDQIKLLIVDVSKMESIRNLVQQIEKEQLKFDVLVNNAGVLLNKLERIDNLELTFASNTLGGFLLTNLLLEKKLYNKTARVINVSSAGMYNVKLNLNDINLEKVNEDKFDGVKAYAFTKRQQVILTELWAQKFNKDDVQFFCMHPGWADTPGVEKSLPQFHKYLNGNLRTPEQGMDTTIWLSCTDLNNLQNGSFYFDRKVAEQHLSNSTKSTNEQNWQLWDKCCEMVKQQF